MKINLLEPVLGIALLWFTVSCEVAAEKIDFGKDQCSFCVMNIVDKTHAAQYVTKKGKQFKFDAIECMVNDLSDKKEEELAIILVSDYSNPGIMIPAISATYLISPEIKSPMGANLSAVSESQAGDLLQQKHGGDLFSWESLKIRLADK